MFQWLSLFINKPIKWIALHWNNLNWAFLLNDFGISKRKMDLRLASANPNRNNKSYTEFRLWLDSQQSKQYPKHEQADLCLKISRTGAQCIAQIHSLLKNHLPTKSIFFHLFTAWVNFCYVSIWNLNVTKRFKNSTTIFNWKWKHGILLIFSLEIDWNCVNGLIRLVFGECRKYQKWF